MYKEEWKRAQKEAVTRKIQKICAQCGKRFISISDRSIICSEVCRRNRIEARLSELKGYNIMRDSDGITFFLKRVPKMEELLKKKFNIRICPECNNRYVPTPESVAKCLFCKRRNRSNETIHFTIKKSSTLTTN